MHATPADIEQLSPAIALGIVLVGLFIALVITFIKVWIFCKIFSKAGYSWALGLLMLVPIANLIMPFVLAFGDWPICIELRQLRQQISNTTT